MSAAEKVRDLKAAVRASEAAEDGEPVVYGLLRKEWLDLFEEIQEVLVRSMEKSVLFDMEHNRVRVLYKLSVNASDEIELRTVLEAMGVVGVLDYGLAKVADMLIKYVVIPAVYSCTSPVSFAEGSHQDSGGQITQMTLNIVESSDHKIGDMDVEAIYSKIICIVSFIYKYICLENVSWLQTFGRLAWPRISELIISKFLSKVVPNDASKLVDFQKIVNQTSEFESVLKKMMFISASDNKDDWLSNFAENVEVHFASRKKIETLAKARNLLLRSDFALPQEYLSTGPKLTNSRMPGVTSDHVAELLFSSERFVVSEAVLKLMELVHQTLQDACLSTARVALEFYQAARDAILLYEAVIPVKLESQLDGINHVAALLHNDCLYLSQEILGLAFQYRSNFPGSIKEHTVFVDMAPRFQLMAKEVLQKQIQVIIHNLKEAINGADGFQNTHVMQQYESAKFSIDQVVFILEKVRIIWEPLLLHKTYKKSMCMILESIFARMTADILLLDDMAAEETLQLQRLIQLMLESLSSILDSLIGVNQQSKSQEGFTSPELPVDLIPSLRKVRKLADLLDMPLRSITTAWENGELFSCGFTLSEVEDFIKSIFTESPLRKECLWKIRSVGF